MAKAKKKSKIKFVSVPSEFYPGSLTVHDGVITVGFPDFPEAAPLRGLNLEQILTDGEWVLAFAIRRRRNLQMDIPAPSDPDNISGEVCYVAVAKQAPLEMFDD